LEELKKSVLQKAFSGGLNYDLPDSGDLYDKVIKKGSKSLQSKNHSSDKKIKIQIND
jgi:hypothetical protein